MRPVNRKLGTRINILLDNTSEHSWEDIVLQVSATGLLYLIQFLILIITGVRCVVRVSPLEEKHGGPSSGGETQQEDGELITLGHVSILSRESLPAFWPAG